MEVQLITSLQQRRPLVLAVTNFITAGAVANCLGAAGMSPLMPSDPAEAAELVALADAVVVNIGSVGAEQAALLRAVVTAARQLKKPLVLDPVAVGASQARRQLITGRSGDLDPGQRQRDCGFGWGDQPWSRD